MSPAKKAHPTPYQLTTILRPSLKMIKGLDGFRAMAFLAVFFIHTGDLLCGYLGVLAFFVLSGFLITPILIKSKEGHSLKDYLITFYARRALRIFPPYYAYLFGVAGLIYLLNFDNRVYYENFLRQLPHAVTYCYDFFYVTKFSSTNYLISHFWSLAVEEQFYLVWPFIIYFSSKKNLKSIFIGLIILGPFVRALIHYLPHHGLFTLLIDERDRLVYLLPFSHVDAFVMGAYFSLYVKSALPSKQIVLAIGILILVGFVSAKLTTGTFIVRSLGYRPLMQDSLKYIWGYSAFGLLFSVILVALKQRSFYPSIFEHKVLSYLGQISYGLYIYHFPILYATEQATGALTLFTKILALLVTIGISTISFELFEKRFIELKDRYFSKTEVNVQIELTNS